MRGARQPLDGSGQRAETADVGGVDSGVARQRRSAGGSPSASAKAQRMRGLLLVAAREVFERDGFLNARVTDISAAAGASHGSFYTYFESKTDIFRTLVTEVMDDLYTSLAAGRPDGPELDALGSISCSNRRFVEVYQANLPLMALFEQVTTFDEEVRQLRLRVRERIVARMARRIMRWQTEGLVNPELDPRCTASLLIAMTNSIVHYWLVLKGEDFDSEQLLHTMEQVWAGALGLHTDRVPAGSGARPAAS
ncbi:MAG: Transcriptional regulator, TetR family [Frankiales bacterium]|jgi:AcrR family transcriptional regulator|nr:Transcriptional regulator, TetR family [Frankiales bacterium]